MEQSQLAIVSNGRTLYELAHMNIPAIVLSQHKRESTHSFAYEENNQYKNSKIYASESLNISTNDLWSWHALAHYYDSSNEPNQGINLFDNNIDWKIYGPMDDARRCRHKYVRI